MWDPQDYTIAIALYYKLLGAIYFFVFFPFVHQMQGLLGSNGILPAAHFLQAVRASMGKKAYTHVPTIFWLNCSDKALQASVFAGLCCSILLMLDMATPWMLLGLYILHLSIVTIGQDFLSFGWEMFLLEITFNSFLLSLTTTPNIIVWISLNLLLFRFHFQGGIVKLQSQDVNWGNLTAVAYHYQSQPIPNSVAWYAHKWPLWFHKFSTALMFFIELVVPLAMVGNAEMRLAVWVCFVGLQLMIWGTGNFSYLNHLTVVLSTILISNSYLLPFFSAPQQPLENNIWLASLVSIVGAVLLVLQLGNLWNSLFKPVQFLQRWLYRLYPYHLVNRYGIFAVMTTTRYEIVIEGSDDNVEWKEYLFWHKPSELTRRPRRISPYQPRLDWQAWFLPFTTFQSEDWFQSFLYRLLQGKTEVLALLRENPFPSKPPALIRALIYEYEFTSFSERKQTGCWWKRTFMGAYSPTIKLKSHRTGDFVAPAEI